MGNIEIKGDVKGANINTGDKVKQSIGAHDDSSDSPSKWSWNLGHILTAIGISVAVLTSIAIWMGNVFTPKSEAPPPQTPAFQASQLPIQQHATSPSNIATQPVSPPIPCTHAVMLYDKTDLKAVAHAKVYFLYQNDKYTFYADSEGFYKASVQCGQMHNEGKIHVEAEGYQVYERHFILNQQMQEIRLTPKH